MRLVDRARIVRRAADGVENAAIARELGFSEDTVRKWRGRFSVDAGINSLVDNERSGRPALIKPEHRAVLIQLACDRPKESVFRDVWSYEALQDALLEQCGCDMSTSEIGRTLRSELLRPHKMRVWLHSPDPDFEPKVARICKLYLEPPPGATVVCVDEKPGMQALERKHKTKRAAKGRPGRWEFEYIRHGTRTLIAALDVKTGKVFGRVGATRTGEDLVAFMEELAKLYPTGDVYVVWDNLNIHSDGKQLRWTEFNQRHGGRFHLVYTPKHASWVNQIEIWFSLLAKRVLRNGNFTSADELTARILGFIEHWNRAEAHPFRWKFRGTFKRATPARAA